MTHPHSCFELEMDATFESNILHRHAVCETLVSESHEFTYLNTISVVVCNCRKLNYQDGTEQSEHVCVIMCHGELWIN